MPIIFQFVLMTSLAATIVQAPPTSTGKIASYVRVCRTNHHVADRRACRGSHDPKRTALAIMLKDLQ